MLKFIIFVFAISQMDASIRWGILSTARFNDRIIDVVRQSKNSEIVAVASRSLANAQDYAQSRNIPKAYGSYEELLADPDIDVIFNPLPNSMHAEWTIKAIEAGKHVLCEKPIATTLEDLDRVAAAAALHDVIVFEGFAYLFHPQTTELMKQLDSIGDVQLISSCFHIELSGLIRNGAPVPDSEQIRLNPSLAGGCLLDLGGYCSSISLVIARAGDPVEVWAQWQKGPTGVDILTTAYMKFANNAIAQFSVSFYSPYSAKVIIYGSKGTIALDAPWRPGLWKENAISFIGEFKKEEKIPFPKGNPYIYEIEAMEKGILEGEKPAVSLELSRSFLRVLLALQESADSGQIVKL